MRRDHGLNRLFHFYSAEPFKLVNILKEVPFFRATRKYNTNSYRGRTMNKQDKKSRHLATISLAIMGLGFIAMIPFQDSLIGKLLLGGFEDRKSVV